MIEVDYITLEDGLNYIIVDEIIINNIKYLYLVEENSKNCELRKTDEQENLIKLNNQEEHTKAMLEFAKIHKNDLA